MVWRVSHVQVCLLRTAPHTEHRPAQSSAQSGCMGQASATIS
jgi:hypothetical protein